MYLAFDGGEGSVGIETCHHLANLVDEELGEILGYLARNLLGEVFEERVGIRTAHFRFLETGKLGVVVVFAELVHHLVGAWARLGGLVAWEIEHLKTLRVVFLIQGFKVFILWGEFALCGCVDDEHYFISIQI